MSHLGHRRNHFAGIAAGGQSVPKGIINPVSQCFSIDSGCFALESLLEY